MYTSPAPRWKAITAGTLAVVFWGASFAWIKGALREMTPITLLALRFAIGTGVVWLVAWRTARRRCAISWTEVGALVGLGLLGVTAQQALQTTGIRSAGASAAAWISALSPALIAILAWPMLGERLSLRQALGLFAALLGAGLVAGGSASTANGSPKGALLVLGSAVLWALYSILGKALSARHPPITMTAWGMTFGSVPLILAFVATRAWYELARVSASTWMMVVLLGVASTGLAYGLYFYALSSAEAALVAALQYLEPLITMLLAGWLLQERVSAGMLVGGALILGGVWFVDRAHVARRLPATARQDGKG